jgi:NTE family protein
MNMFGGNLWRTSEAAGPKPSKPLTIGLALGSGAARGWAHIGVLRALNEIGVHPDIVAGTSMGAIVGGCYCAGLLDPLEAFGRRLTRRKVFGLLDINFGGGGLFTGSKVTRLLAAEMKDIRIETLSPRFVCVATELRTGHEVWMQRGNIVNAMRASYAIPGIFQPVFLNGRWLVDGAVVNPVPVSVCRALGADVVIAVNLSSDLFGRGTVIHDHGSDDPAPTTVPAGTPVGNQLQRQLIDGTDGPPGIPAVMIDAYNIIQDRIARSRLAGDPPDVVIGPRLGGIGHFEFHRAREAIEIGYETGRRAAADIQLVLEAAPG